MLVNDLQYKLKIRDVRSDGKTSASRTRLDRAIEESLPL